ncbi:MAG: glycosyl-4,4'-diaponeurosporenoate acyltransferase [Candidatus Omnitrophica bacterium]|nr:glycosyl-4,4'-diaponeurosporenoate acyltransferase [Candidatus Omnitrophota bacterium]
MTTDIIILASVNILAWLVIHIGFAWAGVKSPASYFKPHAWLYQTFFFEKNGILYENLFLIKFWKDRLPDGAAWFQGGFPKKNMIQADFDYLNRFITETCRGELVHWAVFMASGIFFLWNEPWVGWIMVAYGMAANFPCIIVQRYNRNRLRSIVAKRKSNGEVV